jgi:hypothetical protein
MYSSEHILDKIPSFGGAGGGCYADTNIAIIV